MLKKNLAWLTVTTGICLFLSFYILNTESAGEQTGLFAGNPYYSALDHAPTEENTTEGFSIPVPLKMYTLPFVLLLAIILIVCFQFTPSWVVYFLKRFNLYHLSNSPQRNI